MGVDAPYDYYSYQPLVVPEQPIVLTGFVGARVAQTARVASILTGLPLFLLDRAVEHRSGCSLPRLIASAGPRGRHTAEAAVLARPLSEATPPVVALGDTTLLDAGLRWTLRSCRVVHLRQTLDEAVDRLTSDLSAAPASHWHVLAGTVPTATSLGPEFERHCAAYSRRADVEVDVAGRHPRRVAQSVLDRLGLDV